MDDTAEQKTYLDSQRANLDIENFLPSRLSSTTWSDVQTEKRPLCSRSRGIYCGKSCFPVTIVVGVQSLDSGWGLGRKDGIGFEPLDRE
jgi:hypothetical protein